MRMNLVRKSLGGEDFDLLVDRYPWEVYEYLSDRESVKDLLATYRLAAGAEEMYHNHDDVSQDVSDRLFEASDNQLRQALLQHCDELAREYAEEHDVKLPRRVKVPPEEGSA